MNTINQIISSFNTICEMFEYRKDFEIANELKSIGPNELQSLSNGKNVFTIDIHDKLRIIYALNQKNIKTFIVEDFDTYLIVTRDKLTASNIKALYELAPSKIQHFDIRELQFNISKHNLVPLHRLIPLKNEKEIKEIMDRLNIKSKSQMPIIQKSDPMARFMNARTGDIVEITRYSPTSGMHLFYRVCV